MLINCSRIMKKEEFMIKLERLILSLKVSIKVEDLADFQEGDLVFQVVVVLASLEVVSTSIWKTS